MKIKSDFISNSSSSSFIVDSKFHKTTKNVARIMIKRMFDYSDEIFGEPPEIICEKKKFRKEIFKNLRSIKEKDPNIFIPFSCSYDTYIIKDPNENQIKVFSSSNYGSWGDCLYITHYFSEEDSLDFSFGNTLFINIETMKFRRGDRSFDED